MSHEQLPVKCPKCKTKRVFHHPNGYWCPKCERMEYASIRSDLDD